MIRIDDDGNGMTEEQVRMVLAQMGDAEKIDKPVVTLRAMSGGAYVVRLFHALPADQAASLAKALAVADRVAIMRAGRIEQVRVLRPAAFMHAPVGADQAQRLHLGQPSRELCGHDWLSRG